jgi:hypothetical protein
MCIKSWTVTAAVGFWQGSGCAAAPFVLVQSMSEDLGRFLARTPSATFISQGGDRVPCCFSVVAHVLSPYALCYSSASQFRLNQVVPTQGWLPLASTVCVAP